MLVEAGGWPGADPEPLVRLHFHGLLATLHAIGTGRVDNFDPQVYESLPESNSRNLFDCLISGGRVLDQAHGDPFVCDLGIDHSHGNRLALATKRDGRIVDLGDLKTSAGKATIDASGGLVLPGSVGYLNTWSPTEKLSEQQLDQLLARGVTTVIGAVDLADADAMDGIRGVENLPVNWAFVARLSPDHPLSNATMLESISWAAASGVLAVIGDEADESVWQRLDRFGLPLLQRKHLAALDGADNTYRDLVKQTLSRCHALGLDATRGKIARGFFADLQIFNFAHAEKLDASPSIDWQRLSRVVVAGETVWENNRRTGNMPGTFVKR
jgi:N-acyl-D-aspartate/D-glutamate deacylase